jgi:hypothetical protein
VTGRRVHANAEGHLFLAEGDYGYDPAIKAWQCRPPSGSPGMAGSLAKHDVVEHEDGTITVSPSILIRWVGVENGAEVTKEWHGYLRRGVWEPC